MKKLLVMTVVAIVVGIGFLPLYTTKMAAGAFDKPDDPASQESLRKAVQWKMYMYMFTEAREIAEKAIVWFPESPHIDSFLFSAGLCAERENRPDIAIHWYRRFVEIFPEHSWTRQAASRLEKLKALYDDK